MPQAALRSGQLRSISYSSRATPARHTGLILHAGACIGAFASGLAPSYSWLVAARIFIGFCSGTMSTANAYIADISSIKERAGCTLTNPSPALAQPSP